MSAEVMQAADGLLFREQTVLGHKQIMAPSPRIPTTRPKHGRGRHGGSVGRARALSNIDGREVMIMKALTWILRRGVGEKREADGIEVHFDEEGWADCGEVLQWPNLSTFNPTLQDMQHLLSSDVRSRFELRSKSGPLDPDLASSWLIRGVINSAVPTTTVSGTLLTMNSDKQLELVFYATTYNTYARIIASNTIKSMGGGNVSFSTSLAEDADFNAEVLFYIDLRALICAGLSCCLSENETTVTIAESQAVPSEFWIKVVGRKGDVGTLWEHGEVTTELPMGIRGKRVGRGKDLRGRNGRNTSKGGKSKSWGSRDGSE